MSPRSIRESEINIISEGTRLEGKIRLEATSRVHGVLTGEITAPEGSTLILAETALVEGELSGDTIIIDGFVQGNIRSKSKVVISGTGRVVGDIETPVLKVEFGGHFDGRCKMEGAPIAAATSPVT